MFGVLLEGRRAIDDYPLFLMVGLSCGSSSRSRCWRAAPSLLDQGALIRKARFPRETIPAAVVTVQLVTFLVVLAWWRRSRSRCAARSARRSLLLPLVLVALCSRSCSAWRCSSRVLHAYFRDVAPILAAVLLPWFFLSPIFFTPADIARRRRHRASRRC